MISYKRLTYLLVMLTLLLGTVLPLSTVQAAPTQPPTTEAQGDKPAEPQTVVESTGIMQVRDTYAFSSAIGTYTAITGGTVHGSGTGIDDNNYNAINIGFTFRYNGTDYTQLSINANGFVRLGGTAFSGSCGYAPISSTTAGCENVLSAHAEDQNSSAISELRSELLGSSPNQVFVIQWKDFKHYGSTTTDIYNYQIRIYETSNIIEFVYGTHSKDGTNRTNQVGLKGPNATDYENRTTTTDWSASTRGTVNTATMALTSTVYPATGLTYTWTPPPPAANFTTSTKTAPAESLVGDPITYTITITNSGDLATTATNLTDLIPDDTTYVADSLTCSSGTCAYDSGNNQVTWDGAVAIAESISISFQVDPAERPCGSLVNNAAVITDATALPVTVTKTTTTRLVASFPTPFESFDGTTFPPTGWVQTPLVGTSSWDRVTSGTNPTLAPHSGAAMARWNAYNIASGNATRLATPTLTLPVDAPLKLSFFMSHDAAYASNADRIEMQISTDDGATWTDLGIVFNRYDASYTTAGWGLHSIDLSAYAGQTQVQVGFNAISAYGNNFFIDDVALAPVTYPCPCAVTASAQNGCQAQDLVHTLTISCGMAETVDLTLEGNVWDTTISPATVDVPAGGSTEVSVTVSIPFNAALLDNDALTVVATPQSDPAAFTHTTVRTGFMGVYGEWTAMAPLPAGRVFAAEAVTDEYVFVIGGASDAAGATEVATNYRYTIATDTWEEMTGLPVAAMQISAAVLNGKIYIPGAYPGGVWDSNTYVYDIATDTWTTIPTSGTFIGASLYGVAADAATGTIYRVGGIVDDGASGLISTNRVWALDVASSTWTELVPLQSARMNAAVAAIDGQLYAAGGVAFPGFAVVPSTEIYNGTAWSYGAPLPTGGTINGWTYGAYATAWNSMYVFGGRRDSGWNVLNHTGIYHPANDMWMTTPALPAITLGRVYLGGGSNSTALWATGGRNGAASAIYDIHERLNLCVAAVAGISVIPDEDTAMGEAGTDVTYALTLENTGNIADEISLNIDSVWPTTAVPAGPYAVDAYSSLDIAVTVGIPASASSMDSDLATLTFTSGNDPVVSDTATLITTAIVAPAFEKDAPAEAHPGDIITYTITIAPYDLVSATLTDVLPAGVTYVPDSLVVTPDVGTYGYDSDTHTVSWSYLVPKQNLNNWKPAAVSGPMVGIPPTTVGAAATTLHQPRPAADLKSVLWNQPLSTVDQNAYINQDFPDVPTYSTYLADDFTATNTWNIETIFVPGNGWNGFTSLTNATALNFMIFVDDGGVPAGDPAGGGELPVWALSVPPTDAQVVLSNGSSGLPSDVTLTLTTPVSLPAGHYWLVYYPTLPFSGGGQFGRQPADTTNGYTGQLINPGGGLGLGTDWQAWTVLGGTLPDIAFRLEGTAVSEPVVITFDVTIIETVPGTTITNTADLDYSGLLLEAQANTLVVNQAPTADDQAITTDEDVAYTGALTGSDPDGDLLSFALDLLPQHGTIVLDPATGAFTYTPEADYNGTDTFTFTVSDPFGGTDSGGVTVTINPVDDTRYIYLPVILK